MDADSDLELNIDKTVEGFIGEIAPGSNPPAEPELDPAAPPAAPATTSLAKPAVPGAPEPIAYPKSWKQELSSHWEKMPRELQDYVTNTREKDYLNGLEQYKTGHQAYAQIHEVIQPYMPRLTALNLQPADAIRALMNADWVLSQGSPEQKIAQLAQICQTYGIDPAQIKPAGEQPFRTEAEAAILKKFDGLNANVNQFLQTQLATARAASEKEVATFAADPAHPHFKEVEDHIVRLLTADSKLSLADAYEQAVWANPTTRAKALEVLNKDTAEKDRKAREAAAEAARRARLANVRGKPTDKGTGAGKGSWEDELPVTAAAIKNRTS